MTEDWLGRKHGPITLAEIEAHIERCKQKLHYGRVSLGTRDVLLIALKGWYEMRQRMIEHGKR